MRQKLFTKEIDNKLFSQYKFGNDLKNQMVVAKIFNPYGSGTFYLLNSDPSDPDYIWAIVDLFEVEVGSVSRESLEMMKVPPFGLNLERDIYFQPINASELLSRLNQGEKFNNGGKVRGYKIYHDTLAQALEEVEDFFHNEGYLFTSDNYFPDVTVGGIGYGETARITRPIQLQGKSKEGVANIQIYRMDSGRYELNMYPSYANGGVLRNDYYKIKEVDKEGNTYYTYLVKNIASPTPPNAIEISKEEYDMANKFADGGMSDEKLYKVVGKKNGQLVEISEMPMTKEDCKKFIKEQRVENYYQNVDIVPYHGNKPRFKFADGGELQIIKNDSGENYLANVGSTPNEMAVKLAKGGSIPNNYRGRTTEDIWNSLTEDQRIHFMIDHFNELGIKESEIVGLAKKEFQDLNEDVKGEFKVHTMMGQYADGGETFAKGGQVSGYFVFRPYKLEGNFYVNTTIQNEPPNSVIIKGLEGKLKGNDINSAEEIAHNIMQNHPEIAKLDIVKLGATTLKNKKVASFERNDDEYSYKIDYFANGGETNLSRDRMFKSQQSWEQDYKRKTRPKNPHYKKFDNGGGVGFDQYGNPYGFDDEMDSVYEYHYKEEDKNNPYKVWDKMEGVYVAEFPSRQRAIEYIERNRYGYADGGKIKNQYEGRTPEDIWNNLSKEQRSHFIYDHVDQIEMFRGEEYGELSSKEIIKAYNSDYKDLDKNIRNRFDNHTREGEYRLGGEIKVVEGDMIKSKNVKGKVYESSGTMFKLEDEYGNKNPKYFSTKDFKKSEIIKMAKGGMVVTSIKDIPNFKEKLEEGKITYRGLGMGKLYNDFYEKAGESGTRIKVDGKEYFITDKEFDTFSRGSDGKMRIKFDAPQRKGYADGGGVDAFKKGDKVVLKYDIKYRKGNEEVLEVVGFENDKLILENPNKAGKSRKVQMRSYVHPSDVVLHNKMAKGGGIYEGGYSSTRELNQDYKRLITNKERNEFETSENSYVGKTVTIKLPNMADSFRMKVKNEYATMVSGGGKNGGVYDKKYIISKGEGGTTTFKDKVKSISQSLLKRKKVSPSVQKDYGKTYDKKEAVDSAKRIAGAMRSKMDKKKN